MINTYRIPTTPTPVGTQVPDGAEVVNLDSVNIIWVHTEQNVAVGVGFPLQPLASMTKQGTGALYAVSETSPSSLLVGDGLTGYENPIALGAAIALKLAQSGIPNVVTETSLGFFSSPTVIDVSNYASILLKPGFPFTGITYQFFGDANATAEPIGNPDETNQNGSALIPVLGPYLYLSAGASVLVIGSNRSVAPRPITVGFSSEGLVADSGLIAMTSGTVYPMNITQGQLFQGPAFIEMNINPVSTGKGLYQVNTQNAIAIELGHTGEMPVSPDSLGWLFRVAAIPANIDHFSFLARATGTFRAQIKAIPNY